MYFFTCNLFAINLQIIHKEISAFSQKEFLVKWPEDNKRRSDEAEGIHDIIQRLSMKFKRAGSFGGQLTGQNLIIHCKVINSKNWTSSDDKYS